MNEYIDIQMITRGLECNIIRPVLTEDGLTAELESTGFSLANTNLSLQIQVVCR